MEAESVDDEDDGNGLDLNPFLSLSRLSGLFLELLFDEKKFLVFLCSCLI